jgi:uncharacterized protein (TIGR02996 family)
MSQENAPEANMTTQEGFLTAILATPDDDNLRLVYSDWLEDQGWPLRAELIRVQCALASMAEDDPRRGALQQCEQELLGTSSAQWTALREALPICVGWYPKSAPPVHGVFRRGLLEEIRCGPNIPAFLAVAPALFAAQPLRRLAFDFGVVLNPVFGESDPARSIPMPAEKLALLGNCPCLARLPHLGLHGGVLSEEAGATLAAVSHLGGLTSLSLQSSQFTVNGLATVLAATWAARLETLDLRGTSDQATHPNSAWTAEHLIALLTADLPRLQVLDLGDRQLDDEEARLLFDANFPALRVLRVTPRWIGTTTWRRLRAHFNNRITGLDLDSTTNNRSPGSSG